VSDVAWMSAAELRSAYRSGALSPVEATDAVLDRIAELDPTLNAFVTVTADAARAAARDAERAHRSGGAVPPLCGIPVSVKDVVPTAGVRTTMGSRLFEHWVPEVDAPLVERLRRAGAILIGKTTVPELGWKGDSGNLVNGPARNPYDPTLTAGGSSGGAAAAVATGMGPLAQGGDGAGSIRIPAAFCGVVGLKPSHGRVPYAPAGALELLVSEGPITRTVEDAAMMLDALAGPDPRDRLSLATTASPFADACGRTLRARRIAWSPDLGHAPVDAGVARVVAAAVEAFEDLGAVVEAVDPGFGNPHDDLELLFSTAYAGLALDGWGPDYRGDAAAARALLDPGLRALVEQGERHSAAELAAAHLRRLRLCDRVREFLDRFDLLVTPTLPVTAFPAGHDHPGTVAGVPTTTYSWLQFTYPFNLTGLPAITVPAGLTGGLPVGLQIVGRWRDDHAVVAAAAAFEAARPWPRRAMSLHVEPSARPRFATGRNGS
jgi:aspartyl-tRNA(Asn)/glutamyl-tRNA(Gln) amidotransferase subunit A